MYEQFLSVKHDRKLVKITCSLAGLRTELQFLTFSVSFAILVGFVSTDFNNENLSTHDVWRWESTLFFYVFYSQFLFCSYWSWVYNCKETKPYYKNTTQEERKASNSSFFNCSPLHYVHNLKMLRTSPRALSEFLVFLFLNEAVTFCAPQIL